MINDSDRLYHILSSERFLSMQGLANEVPIFIHAYEVANEDRVLAMIKSLASRVRNTGIQVAEVDLFDLFLAELRDEGLLDDFINDETTFDRKSLLGDLKNYAAATRLVPRLVRVMEDAGARRSRAVFTAFSCAAMSMFGRSMSRMATLRGVALNPFSHFRRKSAFNTRMANGSWMFAGAWTIGVTLSGRNADEMPS